MPTRKELKAQAKQAMKKNGRGTYLTTLVFFLILLVLNILSAKLQFPNLSIKEIVEATLETGDPESILLTAGNQASFFGSLLTTAVDFMTIVIGAGFVIFCMNISRGLKAEVGDLFDGFGQFFKFIWLNILIGIFTMLWSLLLIVPGIIASYSYRMAIFIMIDNPEYSAMECIHRSKEMMKGQKWTLFVQDLSFIGWTLLCVIPFVVLYTMPYMEITEINFYRALTNDSNVIYSTSEEAPWDDTGL